MLYLLRHFSEDCPPNQWFPPPPPPFMPFSLGFRVGLVHCHSIISDLRRLLFWAKRTELLSCLAEFHWHMSSVSRSEHTECSRECLFYLITLCKTSAHFQGEPLFQAANRRMIRKQQIFPFGWNSICWGVAGVTTCCTPISNCLPSSCPIHKVWHTRWLQYFQQCVSECTDSCALEQNVCIKSVEGSGACGAWCHWPT